MKCQHLCPIGISAISCIESAENTWSFRAVAPALPEQTIAARAALSCQVAEDTHREMATGLPSPVYVIGAEVPTPGGASHDASDLAVTVVFLSWINAVRSSSKDFGLSHCGLLTMRLILRRR